MEFQPEGNLGKNILLVVGELRYLGAVDLTQYFIRRTDIKFRERDETVLGKHYISEQKTAGTPIILPL